MSGGDCWETIRFLTQSKARPTLLERLREEPRRVCEINETIDLSRRNLQRNLSKMAEMGIVRKRAGRYALTVYGYELAEEYHCFSRKLMTIENSKRILQYLPAEGSLSNVITDQRSELGFIEGDIHDSITVLDRLIDETDVITCTIPTVEAEFLPELLEWVASDRAAELRIDDAVPPDIVESILETYDSETPITYGETPGFFVINANNGSAVAIVTAEGLFYTTSSNRF